jgi:hypothetical protein
MWLYTKTRIGVNTVIRVYFSLLTVPSLVTDTTSSLQNNLKTLTTVPTNNSRAPAVSSVFFQTHVECHSSHRVLARGMPSPAASARCYTSTLPSSTDYEHVILRVKVYISIYTNILGIEYTSHGPPTTSTSKISVLALKEDSSRLWPSRRFVKIYGH